MAITRLKNWNSGEVLTASDLNAEFNNIINAGISLISPIGASFDLNGNELVLDSDGDSTLHADTDDKIDIRIGGADSMAIGHATGNTGAFLNVDPGAFTATASTDIGRVRVGNTNAVTVPAGTTAIAASLFVEEPNLTATGTITDAATVYIEAAPTEGGTGNFALWVDAGAVKIDDTLTLANTGLHLLDTDASHDLIVAPGSNLTADRTLTITTGDADRTLTLSGDVTLTASPIEQGTHTIFIPAAAMRPTVSNGCASLTEVETTAGRPDMQVLDFDTSSDEHAQFQVAFPKSWNEGTITFQVYWTSAGAVSTGVAWGLQGVAVTDGDTIDVAYGTAVVVTDDAQGTAEDLYVTSVSSAVTIAGTPAADDICYFRIFRDVSDANDDMTQDARLIGVKLFYTVDAGNDA